VEKLPEFSIGFLYVAKTVKDASTFLLLSYRVYSQIWLNCVTDDHHFSYFTKTKNKALGMTLLHAVRIANCVNSYAPRQKKSQDHGSMQLVDNGHVDGLLNNLLSIVLYIFRFDCSYIIFYSVNGFKTLLAQNTFWSLQFTCMPFLVVDNVQ
jgi:hypothetical protein